jgi:tetratricopeptide (TPR) repeat protein
MEINFKAGVPGRIPTIDEFLGAYAKNDYYAAIGVLPEEGRAGIIEAIDRFEIEHMAEAHRWSIPMANLTQRLLGDIRKELKEEPADEKAVDECDAGTRIVVMLMYLEAYEHYSKEDPTRALDVIDEALRLHPGFALGYSLRGDIYRRMGENGQGVKYLEMALTEYGKAQALKIKMPGLYVATGLCYVDIGGSENRKKACEEYRKALEIEPGDAIVVMDMMEVELCDGRYEDVVATYGEYLATIKGRRENEVVASSIVSIALALNGKPYGEYLAPLLSETAINPSWSTYPIDNYLAGLGNDVPEDRRKMAFWLQGLLKKRIEAYRKVGGLWL